MQERGSVAPLNEAATPTTDRARRRRLLVLGIVTVVIVGLDQLTKSLAVAHLTGHDVEIVGPIGLRLGYNSGVAFSLGTSLTAPIIIVAVVLVGAIVWFARRVPTTPAAIGVGMILGGAIGNLIDRLVRGHHGAVVDFVYTRYWPTFNLADASIVCGCILVAWSLLRRQDRHERAAPAPAAGTATDVEEQPSAGEPGE